MLSNIIREPLFCDNMVQDLRAYFPNASISQLLKIPLTSYNHLA